MTSPGPIRRLIEAWTGVPDVPAAKRWALVAIVDATGTGMFLPVSVLYLTVVVGLPMESVGLGLGIAGLLAAVSSPVAGTMVDRFGAKTMVIACLLLAAAGYAGYLGVGGWISFVVVACFAHTADHMARPAKKVFVTTIVSGESRVPLMAFQRAVRNVGYGLGGLVTAGLLLVEGPYGYYAVLVADTVSYLVAAGLVLTIPVLRAASPATSALVPPVATITPRTGYRRVLRDWRYTTLAALNVLVLTYATAFTVGLPLWVHQHTSAPTSLVGVLFTLNTALVTVLQVRLTKGYTRVGQTQGLYLRTAGTFGLAALGYWAANRLGSAGAMVVGVLVVAVLAHTLTELYGAVAEWTVSVNLAPERLRGRYLAVFSLSLTVQQAVGPGLVTLLISTAPNLVWFGLAGLLALGCLTSAWLVHGAVEPDDLGERAGTAPPFAVGPGYRPAATPRGTPMPDQTLTPEGHAA